MSEWEVTYSEQAELDLRGIFEYIALSLLEPEVAKRQTVRILEAIQKLNALPMRFRLYDKEPWHSRGLRVLPVDNYSVFYLLTKKQRTVLIVRIMYGGRNIEEQLQDTYKRS